MVTGRRFAPLIIIVVVGIMGLVARLYQVQIVEREIWARERANLVRTERMIPYLRGKITDRNGQVFVQDEEAFAIRFTYRKFRRDHPLGQVAHARSVLELRSVELQTAALHLEEWGLELVDSRAGALAEFADGKAVDLCGWAFPEVGPGKDRRRSRAGQLQFYVARLLKVSRRDWSDIKKDLKKGRGLDSSWAELAAQAKGVPVEEVRADVVRRMGLSLKRLEQLAEQLNVVSMDGVFAVSSEESLWYLLEGIDEKRREIEDAIAKDLFEEAAGFDPGRIETDVLLGLFDLEFLTEDLGWSPGRLQSWARSMRRVWLENRRTYHVPRAEIRARLREDRGEQAEDALFSELAALFNRKPRTKREARQRSRDWYGMDRVAVFFELPELFERIEMDGTLSEPLPFMEEGIRARYAAQGWSRELLLQFIPFDWAAEVFLRFPPQPYVDWRGKEHDPWRAPGTLEEAGDRLAWQIQSASGHDPHVQDPSEPRDKFELLPWIEHLWGAQYQGKLNDLLARVGNSAQSAGFQLPLRLTEDRVQRARKKLDYFVRDRGSRPERIDEAPDDLVVNTLTRYVKEYAGFEVEPRTRRLAMALDRDELLVARELIGVVRQSTLAEVLEQQYGRAAFSRIMNKEKHSAADVEEAGSLVSELYRADEVHGTSGIEGLMDKRLRGRNGFVENEGLQQRSEGTRASLYTPKIDGEDVVLTLSMELQRAAQNTIEHPSLPLGEDQRDEFWFRNPVGAIVLASVDGEILAAASGPKQPGEASAARDGERAYNYDRTLRMPLFQPMGSIFKPFVAAYALGNLGLDPEQKLACEMRASGTAGWGKVACWNSYGHGVIALDEAIHHSCNAYFAQVGELYQTKSEVTLMAHMFGLDQPSGVRDPGSGRGLFEMHVIGRLRKQRPFSQTDLHRAANGLAVIEATPVQVARAVAGLATGFLPRMRLVKSVGGEALPQGGEPLALPAWALERVREGMAGVITVGSARGKLLGEKTLGFRIAGKTGSADYQPMTDAYMRELRLPPGKRPQMRKHTWFVGFFPVEKPTNVLVVYCHDIGVTASHSAVHVASQFLRTPEVHAYMQGAIR